MPGEIVHIVRFPATIELTETLFKALEALAKAEGMTIDEEISSIVSKGVYPWIEVCQDMGDSEKHALLDMLRRHGES